jgi:hypothetical protein
MKKSKFILLSLSMLVWSGTATADLFGGGKWCEIPYEASVMRFNSDKVIMVINRGSLASKSLRCTTGWPPQRWTDDYS